MDGTKKHFRHFSMASPVIKAAHQLVFNCGKCIFCRKKKSTELALRCVLHASLYQDNAFITLTYDETKDGYQNNINYKHIQLFKKAYRQFVWREYGKRIQIFNVHEYGKNGKKHWHLVVFNHDFKDKTYFTTKNSNRYYISEKLKKLWPYGHHTIGQVTEASAMYQAQYTQKDFKYNHVGTLKKSHSKHSGIGRDYFLKNYDQILRLGYIPMAGKKVPIPRYFIKLAHKHYSHFYEPKNFWDTELRKKLYTPFKKEEDAKKDIANLYVTYQTIRESKLEEIRQEWEQHIEEYLYNKQKPDFAISAENYLYDLKNRNSVNEF